MDNSVDFLYCHEVLELDSDSGPASSQTTSDSPPESLASSSPTRRRYARKIGPRKTIVKKTHKQSGPFLTETATPPDQGPVEIIVTIDTPQVASIDMVPFNVDDFFA